jgi:phosphatidylinositol alpha-1,6-mannosyltransferase
MHDYYFAEAPKNPFYYKKYYSDWIKRWIFYNFTRIMERRAVNKLAFVITNTDYVRRSILRNYRAKKGSVQTIYYGIDIPPANKNNKDAKVTLAGNPSILFVGGNFQRKGLPTLLRSVARLKKAHPGILVSVAGKDAKENEMRKLARELGIEKNVHFLGWMDNEEVRHLFSDADVFAMPSLIEGFGLVFLEAMAAGTPAIGGETGGTPELIRDGINGFLVKPGDWLDLSDKIEKLIVDKTLKEKMIKEGLKTFQGFSIDHMVEGTIEVYSGLLQQDSR